MQLKVGWIITKNHMIENKKKKISETEIYGYLLFDGYGNLVGISKKAPRWIRKAFKKYQNENKSR